MTTTYRVRALSLRKTKLGESDLIVTFLAEDGCQIRAVAKGVRKTTSRFGARLEPFSVADIMLAHGRTLEIVTEAETVASHDALRGDFDAVRAAAVVVDFLEKVSVECQTEDRIFALGTTTLDVIEASEPEDHAGIVTAFLAKGMAMHGYRPGLSVCVTCAGEAGERPSFSLASGGVVCGSCIGNDTSVIAVSPGVPEVLGALLMAKLSDVRALEIPRPLLREALLLLKAFVSYHVPARLKALDAYVREV
ncbi:MAG: DNA repair protein RecO [Coriobacteriia bacterium]